MASASNSNDEQVVKALLALRNTFDSGITKGRTWRRKQLQALRRLCVEGREELCAALKQDLNKSFFEGYFFEVNQLEHEINEQLCHLDEWMTPESVSTDLLNLPGSSFIKFDPLGVCCIIGAWNYPVLLTLQPLVGCIAAGNCALVKVPSNKYSAATSKCIARLCKKYLDPTAVTVLEGDRYMTGAILKCRYDKYFFTGGSFVGKLVYQAAARELTPAILELGGKSPCVVDRSCDIKVTALRLCQGKFANAGQTCIAPDYLLVHEDVADALFAEMRRVVKRFFGEDVQKSGDFGRLINDRAFQRVQKLLDASRPFVKFGGHSDASDRYVEPTLLDFGSDVGAFSAAPVMQEEIFAPLMPALRYKDFDEVLKFTAKREKPLSFYIYANDKTLVKRAYESTTSGAFVANDCLVHMSNHELPFGGVGHSGMGAYHGKHSFAAFSHKKACMIKPAWADLALRFFRYPQAGRSEKVKDFVFKVTYMVQYPYSILPRSWWFWLVVKALMYSVLLKYALSFAGLREWAKLSLLSMAGALE